MSYYCEDEFDDYDAFAHLNDDRNKRVVVHKLQKGVCAWCGAPKRPESRFEKWNKNPDFFITQANKEVFGFKKRESVERVVLSCTDDAVRSIMED